MPYSYHVTDAKRRGRTKGKELENGKLEIEGRRTKGGRKGEDDKVKKLNERGGLAQYSLPFHTALPILSLGQAVVIAARVNLEVWPSM